MSEGPRGPGDSTGPEPPAGESGGPGAPGGAAAWTAFALGPRGSTRRTSAIRGLVAAIVVLVIGLPLAIALPGGGTPAAAPSPSPGAHHEGSHCPKSAVTGGEQPPAMQPAAAAPGATVFVFGLMLREHGSRPAAASHVEVWLNTDEPDPRGASLGAGPVKLLATEKPARDCTFAISFRAPRLPSGDYEVRAFAFTDASKRGWEELGGRVLTIARHAGPASKTGATTFAADFLLARLIHAGAAVKAMLSKSADFPAAGEPGALFAQSYHGADVTSIRSMSKGTYRADVRITSAHGPPVRQTLDVGTGSNPRGDDLSLVVTRVLTMSAPVS